MYPTHIYWITVYC